MRKGVAGKPPAQEYQEKKAQLEELKRLDEQGKIDLYYLDETGFCLIPCVPYGWQEIGEYWLFRTYCPKMLIKGSKKGLKK